MEGERRFALRRAEIKRALNAPTQTGGSLDDAHAPSVELPSRAKTLWRIGAQAWSVIMGRRDIPRSGNGRETRDVGRPLGGGCGGGCGRTAACDMML